MTNAAMDELFTTDYTPPLSSAKVESAQMAFFIDLKENRFRSRFVKIIEGRKKLPDYIIVPIETMPEFVAALRRMMEKNQALG